MIYMMLAVHAIFTTLTHFLDFVLDVTWRQVEEGGWSFREESMVLQTSIATGMTMYEALEVWGENFGTD